MRIFYILINLLTVNGKCADPQPLLAGLSNNQFSASHEIDGEEAYQARLNVTDAAWRSDEETSNEDDINDQTLWIQVNFTRQVYVTRIETRGFKPSSRSIAEYVKEYKVAYMQNKQSWQQIRTTESDGDLTTVC